MHFSPLVAVATLVCFDDPSLASVALSGGDVNIIGGEQTIQCGWPSTVYMGGCSGSLIHPRVVMSATHCGGGSKTIIFGDTQDGEFMVSAECKTAPEGKDWSYCILAKEVTGVPIVPPIFGCEVDLLKTMIGKNAVVAGFGVDSWENGNGSGGFHKQQMTVKIEAIDDQIQVSGDKTHSLCHGDSGGPLFVRLKNKDGSDGGWRMAGQTHGPGSDNAECAGNSQYSNVWDAIKVIEANEGIDVTPCTTADGKWEPGPDCRDFPTNPGEAGGVWAATPTSPSCDKPDTVMPATCGTNTNDDSSDETDSSSTSSHSTTTSHQTSSSNPTSTDDEDSADKSTTESDEWTTTLTDIEDESSSDTMHESTKPEEMTTESGEDSGATSSFKDFFPATERPSANSSTGCGLTPATGSYVWISLGLVGWLASKSRFGRSPN